MLHCKHWHPAMSKTDKIPVPKELYLRGCGTRGREDGGHEGKQINKAIKVHKLKKQKIKIM